MKILKDFNIPFSSLKLGSNIFNFEIEKTFFEAFNYTRYDDCNIKLHLDFKRKHVNGFKIYLRWQNFYFL